MAGLVNSFWGGGGVSDSFVMEITTIGASESFTFPFYNGGTYTNCTIDFGDGGGAKTISTWNDANATNIYATADTYTITISADECGGVYFNGALPDLRVDDIQSWGTIDMAARNFYGCSNMIITATDIPDFTTQSTMTLMFRGCTSLTDIPNIASWDVSTIGQFSQTFSGCTSLNPDIGGWDISAATTISLMVATTIFNRDISGWTLNAAGCNIDYLFYNNNAYSQSVSGFDTTNATSMAYLFYGVTGWTESLSSWDTGRVTSMESMFENSNFNLSIDTFDVANVTSMVAMFKSNTAYNQHMNSWITTSLTNISNMFNGATAFNQSLNHFNVSGVTSMISTFFNTDTYNQHMNSWDVSACTTFQNMFRLNGGFNQALPWTFKTTGTVSMSSMFNGATAFDQSLASWDVTAVNNFATFIGAAHGLSTANYDATLIGWELLNLTDSLTVDFGTSTYSDPGAGATARAAIVADDSWTINDGGGV